jgi:predicted ATPase
LKAPGPSGPRCVSMASSQSGILTPDQRLRVFVSSTLNELAEERSAVRRAIEELHLTPVMFESGARPHPPQQLYRAYLAQSHIFVGIYWQSYGWISPSMEISGLEDEYRLSVDKPRLIYIKGPAPQREAPLSAMLDRILNDSTCCYAHFTTADELGKLVENDLIHLLGERFQTTAPGDQPLSVSSEPTRATLPLPSTPLFGRASEVAHLCALFSNGGTRLLTLTGPPGTGKTRLAIQVGREVADLFADGVKFVPLASARVRDDVVNSIASAVGARRSLTVPLSDAVSDALRSRRCLLVLDNLEQVLDATQDIAQLLATVPELVLLCTSRAALRIRGEREFPVGPLGAPPAVGRLAVGDARQYASIELFVDRARAVRPDFILTPENVGDVAAICRMLDGLPLALELAAANTRILSPRSLRERLAARKDLPKSTVRDLPERQGTMRATMDWSYDLLSPSAQALLARLAVFTDGFTLNSVEAVCSDSADGGHESAEEVVAVTLVTEPLDCLATLVDQSLVIPESSGALEFRFTMLAVTREYARERLVERGELAAIGARHAFHFLELAKLVGVEFHGPRDDEAYMRWAPEYGNFMTALSWLESSGNAEEFARMCVDLELLWDRLGKNREAWDWLTKAVALSGGVTDRTRATVFSSMSFTAAQLQDPQAQSLAERAVRYSEDANLWASVGLNLSLLGLLAGEKGDAEAAARYNEEALEVFDRIGDRRGLAIVTSNKGYAALRAGDIERAKTLTREGLELAREVEHWLLQVFCTLNLGYIEICGGDMEAAAAHMASVLPSVDDGTVRSPVPPPMLLVQAFDGLARAAAADGRVERAARLWGASEALLETEGKTLRQCVPDPERYELALALAEASADLDVFTRAWTDGRYLSQRQAIALARDE